MFWSRINHEHHANPHWFNVNIQHVLSVNVLSRPTVLTCVIILLSVVITSITALSVSAIATNGRVYSGEWRSLYSCMVSLVNVLTCPGFRVLHSV